MVLFKTETTFEWGVGVKVNSSMWIAGEPKSGDTVARMMTTSDGQTALASHSNPLDSFRFVCQGYPGR